MGGQGLLDERHTASTQSRAWNHRDPPLFLLDGIRLVSPGHTEGPFMACTWFDEFCSCCGLPPLRQLACTMYEP